MCIYCIFINLSSPVPSLVLQLLFLKPTESPLCCQYVYGCRTISSRSMGSLSEPTSLKTMHSLSNSSQQSSIDSQLGVSPCPIHAGILSDSILCRFWAYNHSHCESMYVSTHFQQTLFLRRCLWVWVLQSFYAIFYNDP